MDYRKVFVNDKSIDHSILTAYGYDVNIRDWKDKIDRSHSIVFGAHSRFSQYSFQNKHTPLIIGEVYDREKFSRVDDFPRGLKVFNCPIKYPGDNEYRIPKELGQFDEVIAKIISFEHAINPYSAQYYAYLTVDQALLQAGHFHNGNEYRIDGFQDVFAVPKRPIARSYMIYDRVPERFYCQNFTIKEFPTKKETINAIIKQANETDIILPENYSIIGYDAYSVYRSTTMLIPFYRTFFRLTFDTYKYCDHNTENGVVSNPMFS